MSPRGRRPPTTPGEVPLHRLQRQRGAGRKPAELAIPFVIVGGHGSPVTHHTPSPPRAWPSDMEEPQTPVAEATLRTRDRIPTPHPANFFRPRSSSAPPSAGSRSRNMYYIEDAETTLVAGDQSDEVSSLTLVGESSFSEYDSDSSSEEEYSDDDDDDEENEYDEDDDDEEMEVYYVESPIQEEDARRERTFEVEVPEHEDFQEQQEEEEEEYVEYDEDAEIKEEEMDDENEFDLSMMSAVEANETEDDVQDVIESSQESVVEHEEDLDYSVEVYREEEQELDETENRLIPNISASVPTGQIQRPQQYVDVEIEERRSQVAVSQGVKQEAPESGPTPFPGTPPLHGDQLNRRNPISVQDGERFLDSQVCEASPTPRGNSQWLGRPLELTPGKDFFEGEEQWASDWEGRALGSPLSRKRNRRVAVEEPEIEYQAAAHVEYDDDELEPYTPEPEVDRRDRVVEYDDGKLEPYTPEPEEDEIEPYTPEPEANGENRTIQSESDGLEPDSHGLRWYKRDTTIMYEGGELKPYTPGLQADRQNTTIIHDEQNSENHTSAADTTFRQSGVLPSLEDTASIDMEDDSNSETDDDHYNSPPAAPPQMNEPHVSSVGVDENHLYQPPAGIDSGDFIGYGGGDDNDHMDDDDNDRMYAFKPKMCSERGTTLFEGRNVRDTGSPNIFNMPLPPPSEFDSSDERLSSPMILSDRTIAIMALPPLSNVNSGDECPFSPMLSDRRITARSQPPPDSNCGRSLQLQLSPAQRPMHDCKARHVISRNRRDDSDFPSSPPTVRWNILLHKDRSALPAMVDDYQEGMDQQSSRDGDDEQSEDGSCRPISPASCPPPNNAPQSADERSEDGCDSQIPPVSSPPTNNPPDSAVNGTQDGNLNNLNSVLGTMQGQREVDNRAVEEARVDTTRQLFAIVDTPIDMSQNAVRLQTRPSWLRSIADPAEALQAMLPAPEYPDLGTSIPSFRNFKKKDTKIPLTRPVITKQHRVRKIRSRKTKLAPRSRADGPPKSIFGFDDPIVRKYFEDRRREIEDAAREASAKLEAPWLKRVEVPRPKPWYLKTCIDDVPEHVPNHVPGNVPKTARYEAMSPTPAKPNKKRRASWDSREDSPKKQRVDTYHPDDSLQNHHGMLNKLMKKRKYKSPGIFKSAERFPDGTLVHPIDTSHRLDCFLAVATGKVLWFPAEEQESAWEHCGQEALFGEYGLVSEMGMDDEARGLWAGKPNNGN